MRCDKMHATIAVQQCLANQKKLAGIEGSRAVSLRYPGCKDCPTGELARAGKLSDDDLKTLLDGYHDRTNPPADVVTLAESKVTESARKQEETVKTDEGAGMETKKK